MARTRSRMTPPTPAPWAPSPVPEDYEEANVEARADAAKPASLAEEIRRAWAQGRELRHGSARERAPEDRTERTAGRLTPGEALHLTPAQQLAYAAGFAESGIEQYVRLMQEAPMVQVRAAQRWTTFQVAASSTPVQIIGADVDRLALQLIADADGAVIGPDTGVTTTSGFPVPSTAPLALDLGGEVWTVASSPTTVSVVVLLD